MPSIYGAIYTEWWWVFMWRWLAWVSVRASGRCNDQKNTFVNYVYSDIRFENAYTYSPHPSRGRWRKTWNTQALALRWQTQDAARVWWPKTIEPTPPFILIVLNAQCDYRIELRYPGLLVDLFVLRHCEPWSIHAWAKSHFQFVTTFAKRMLASLEHCISQSTRRIHLPEMLYVSSWYLCRKGWKLFIMIIMIKYRVAFVGLAWSWLEQHYISWLSRKEHTNFGRTKFSDTSTSCGNRHNDHLFLLIMYTRTPHRGPPEIEVQVTESALISIF